MTRIGLVGVGYWGRHILRDLCTLHCKVTAVARSAESVRRAEQGGATRVCAALEELDTQDAYVIATPATLHATHIRALLPHGRPIFCEKPLTTSSAEIEAFGPTARALVFCMDKWRYHLGVRWLAGCARDRLLGDVQGLSLIRVDGVSPRSRVTALWHLMPHDLAIALEILGTVPEVRASCASRLEDWSYGAEVLLGHSPWVTIRINERRAAHYREVRLVCAEGEATLSGAYATHIVVRRHSRWSVGEPTAVPIGADMPLLAELSAFVSFVRGDAPSPKSSFDDAALMVRRIEETHRLAGVSMGAEVGLP